MNYSNQQISDLNQIERDKWVSETISKYFKVDGNSVLDVGAGTSPYKNLLAHLRYIAHDFGEYYGEKLGGTYQYADLDIKSDITAIPLNDKSIDYLLCTEVLEHIPEPVLAFQEFSRLLKSGGFACITVPFTSGSHQEPYHFYSGFSLNFFKSMCLKFGFELVDYFQHGGFFRLMAQEILRMTEIYKTIKNNSGFESDNFEKLVQIENSLANELIQIELSIGKSHQFLNGFSIGYGVILKRQ